MGLNRERAEAYLRLVAEGELCRAATFPQAAAAAALYGLPTRQREAIALQHYARLPTVLANLERPGLSRSAGYVRLKLADGPTVLPASQPHRCSIGAVITAPMFHRVG